MAVDGVYYIKRSDREPVFKFDQSSFERLTQLDRAALTMADKADPETLAAEASQGFGLDPSNRFRWPIASFLCAIFGC
jgi:hypothetical protein